MLHIQIETPADLALAPPPALDLAGTSLFLDLDGTLAEIEATPDAVGPQARRNWLLSELARKLNGRLAVLSGRSVAEIDRILGETVRSAAGVHGLERRTPDGDRIDLLPHPDLPTVIAMLESFAKGQKGLLVEIKERSVGLHYRQHPQAEAACLDVAQRLAAAYGLTVQEGAMVVELRTPGPDKGDALALFMREPMFAGGAPVMVGDDLTDEDAFNAAIALGGFGVLVGDPRPTAARYRLRDPRAVLAWLEESIA
jgi:trehalose 6-phosphate phosphatase